MAMHETNILVIQQFFIQVRQPLAQVLYGVALPGYQGFNVDPRFIGYVL